MHIMMSFMLPVGATSVSIVSQENYQAIQLENDVLYDKALNGELINNEHTQVRVYYENDGKDEFVEIKKLLLRTELSNGDIEEARSIETIGTRSTGQLQDEQYSPSTSVRLAIGAYYDLKMRDSFRYYKVTKFWCKATLADGSFRLKQLSGRCVAFGVNYNGHAADNRSTLSAITNPSNGQKYYKTTGFTEYVNNQGISYVVVRGEIKYGRGTGTTSFAYDLEF